LFIQSFCILNFAFFISLPAGFGDTGKFSFMREFPETQAAETELADECPRPATKLATVVFSRCIFWFVAILDDF